MFERDVGMGLILDSDEVGGVFVEQLMPSSISNNSGQVCVRDCLGVHSFLFLLLLGVSVGLWFCASVCTNM